MEPTSFAELRKGCYDIDERVMDMNANGVLGSLCFPSFPHFCGQLFARTEGLLLDPVYSGKGAAGLIDLIRKGRFGKTENVIFLHTGGAPGLFAYRQTFERAMN